MGKLQELMLREMELKGYSANTIHAYLGHMTRYTGYIGMSPADAGEVEVKRYLYHLISDQKLSRSYVNQTYSALKIFYEKVMKKSSVVGQIPRVKKAKKLPVVLSTDEVARLLRALSNLKHRTILTVIYSAGLRLNEVCQLKVSDIDSGRMQVRVRQGKGIKDRYTILAKGTLPLLRLYWQAYRPTDWLFPGQVAMQPIHGRPNTRRELGPGFGVWERLPVASRVGHRKFDRFRLFFSQPGRVAIIYLAKSGFGLNF